MHRKAISSMVEGEIGFTVPWAFDKNGGFKHDSVDTFAVGTACVEVRLQNASIVATDAGLRALAKYTFRREEKPVREMAEGEVGYVTHWTVDADGTYRRPYVCRSARGTANVEVVRWGVHAILTDAGRTTMTMEREKALTPREGSVESLVCKIVMHDQIPTDHASCIHELEQLAMATAEGRLSGRSAWVAWGVGSWMKEKLGRFIHEAQSISGASFLRMVIEAQPVTGVPWRVILNRPWVPLSSRNETEEHSLPEAYSMAQRELQARADSSANPTSPRPTLPPTATLEDRWKLYLEGCVSHPAHPAILIS